MANLKEYRDNELKWFLAANILLMLISSNIIFGRDNNELTSWIENLGKIIDIAIFSVTSYVFTFVLDSIIPSRIKTLLLFLWKKQPSCTIFTQIQKKCEDDRFTAADAPKQYHAIYLKLQQEDKPFSDQTPLWYRIYNKHRDNAIVFGSNKDYLLLRDLYAQTIVLLIVYIMLLLLTGIVVFSRSYFVYLLIAIAALNIAARNQGRRMVYNVLAVDINARKTVTLQRRKANDKTDL